MGMTDADHNTRPTHNVPDLSSDRVSFDVSNWKFHSKRGKEPTEESYRRRIQGIPRGRWHDVSYGSTAKGRLPKRTS